MYDRTNKLELLIAEPAKFLKRSLIICVYDLKILNGTPCSKSFNIGLKSSYGQTLDCFK